MAELHLAPTGRAPIINNTVAKRRPTESVAQASEQGSHLELLVALRHNISAAIDAGVAARDLAALSRRLIEIDREVRSLSRQEDPVEDGINASADEWPAEPTAVPS